MVTHCKVKKLTPKQRETLALLMGIDIYGLEQKGLEIIELFAHIATGSASSTEIAAASSILDGVDTPVLVSARSTSANDTDAAGGHARTILLLGWGTGTESSGTTVLQEETIALSGLTPVSSTKYWERLLHFEVNSWGTGGKDAAGEIQINDMSHSGYTAEKTTITATNALLLSDADWFQFTDFNASTQTQTRFNAWIKKTGGGSAPSLTGTEIEVDITGTEVKQACTIVAKAPGVAEVSTITAKAPGAAGISTIVATAPGAAEVSTIVAKEFGTAEVSTCIAKAFGTAEVSTIVADTFANCIDGTYIVLYGMNNTDWAEDGYYVWLDKVGDDSGDPAPGGGLTEIDCDISGDVTAQDVSDCITAAINAVGLFGAANGGGTSTTITITNAYKGACTNIADTGSTGLAVAVTTPGVTNMPDGSYFNLYGTNATYGETTYYVWFDKRGDSGADPTPGGTAIRCDISADVTDQDVSDCITAAIDAQGDFGAANGGGASTTVTITNARKGANTNIVDNDSTLTLATTTPGVTNIPNGGYINLYSIVDATKAPKLYYLWFDKVGDDASDPAPGGTGIDIDISADVSAQDISDAIVAVVNALGEFGATNGGGTSTTVTITNAYIGAVTNIADVDTTLTCATTVPGTNLITDGTYFKLYGIDSATKAETKYYVWFDWIGDDSGDPAPATFTEIKCDISADITAQNVSDCIAAAITAKADFGAANSASTTTTVTNATIGANTNITDEDSGLALTQTTPGTLVIGDGTYITLQGITHATKATKDYYLWFDWIGDSSGDPAPGGTGIEVDMSSLTTIKNVADAITVAVDAISEFGCADDDTTCTITNASIGTVTDAADVDTTMTVATTTPGTNVLTDGLYFTISAINGSGVQVDHYCWFDWIGDESGDPAVADHTSIKFDISDDTSIATVSDCIQTAMHAATLFTATDNGTTTTATSANEGDCDDIADVNSTLTLTTSVQGGSTATQVATAIVTAINGSAALSTAAETTYPAFSITNDYAGDATDSADGSAATNFTFVKNIDGDGPVTEYLSIVAGTNQSNGSRIYVPDGYSFVIVRASLRASIDMGDNSAVVIASKHAFDNENNTDPDLDALTLIIWDLIPLLEYDIIDVPREGTDEAYIKFMENYVTASVANDFKILIFLIKG